MQKLLTAVLSVICFGLGLSTAAYAADSSAVTTMSKTEKVAGTIRSLHETDDLCHHVSTFYIIKGMIDSEAEVVPGLVENYTKSVEKQRSVQVTVKNINTCDGIKIVRVREGKLDDTWKQNRFRLIEDGQKLHVRLAIPLSEVIDFNSRQPTYVPTGETFKAEFNLRLNPAVVGYDNITVETTIQPTGITKVVTRDTRIVYGGNQNVHDTLVWIDGVPLPTLHISGKYTAEASKKCAATDSGCNKKSKF